MIMEYVQEKIKFCKKCNRNTKHYRNAKKPNYLLHLILIIVTGGLWIVPFLFLIIFGIEIWRDKYRCEACG
jgi:uncharacterized protein (DUF983 family)